MPFNQQHMLFSWTGHFVTTSNEVVDDFAGGLRFVGPGRDNNATEEVLDALARTFLLYIQDGRCGIPNSALFDNFKWNAIGTDGRYVDRQQTLMTNGSPKGAGAMSPIYPTQIACCTTWTTDFQRGRASKGRTFWPTNHPISSSNRFHMPTSTAQAMADWSIDLITALNRAATTAAPQPNSPDVQPVGSDPNALVAAVMSDLGSGTSGIIKGARVGDRLDVQRRRGNRVPEAYAVAS
jgi:hypothetical protein